MHRSKYRGRSCITTQSPNTKSCQFHCALDIIPSTLGATRWRSCLRHCATRRKVAGHGVNEIFHRRNLTGRTVALESTRLLTEMSTRNISCGVKPAGTWNIEIWKPQPPGTLRASSGIALLEKLSVVCSKSQIVLSSHCCCQISVKIRMCRFGRSLSYRHYVSWGFVQWFWCLYSRTCGPTDVVELMGTFCRLKLRMNHTHTHTHTHTQALTNSLKCGSPNCRPPGHITRPAATYKIMYIL